MAIAVLDIGKTNAKVILLDEAGAVLAQRSRPSTGLAGPPYPQLDLDGTWDWAKATLAELASAAPIRCIVPVAHGAAGVLMAGERPALPALDYEHDGPEAVAAELATLLDPFALTASPVLPLGLNVGTQLLWQQRRFPDAFARATDLLMLPQYWAWRLSGVKASEFTTLGSHTHLWRPAERRLSGLVARCGWRHLFPPRRAAWEPLGPVTPEVAAATGLPRDCLVLTGIHDSNASWLPHILARAPPFTVLSTGTWVIALTAGTSIERLDPAADMLANVDARGDPVPGARFMGGREIELVAGADAVLAPSAPEDVAALIADGVMALPAFTPGSGPFIGRAGAILGSPGPQPARRGALGALYAALVVDVMLDKLGTGGPVVVEGSFHRNAAFCGVLAALRRDQPVHATDDPSGTARGAWLLALWADRPSWPNALPPPTAAWPIAGLASYRARWRDLSYGGRPA
ncbi:MAG: FGGY family carbohydrate kinase [Geminicoccaceae bacterium]